MLGPGDDGRAEHRHELQLRWHVSDDLRAGRVNQLAQGLEGDLDVAPSDCGHADRRELPADLLGYAKSGEHDLRHIAPRGAALVRDRLRPKKRLPKRIDGADVRMPGTGVYGDR